MSRRYAEQVEVRIGSESMSGPDLGILRTAAPSQFLWRGRLYLVRVVLAHWVEDRAWWRHRGPDGLPAVADAGEQQVWRVEAAAGRSTGTGVYDLVLGPGGWRLRRLQD
jgi:hypothetical protein